MPITATVPYLLIPFIVIPSLGKYVFSFQRFSEVLFWQRSGLLSCDNADIDINDVFMDVHVSNYFRPVPGAIRRRSIHYAGCDSGTEHWTMRQVNNHPI